MKIKVGVVDDQQLFLKSLRTLVDTFPAFETVLDALNGEELMRKMEVQKVVPDILLIDVNMPRMNGIETTRVFLHKHPLVRVVALSMKDDDLSIIAMLKAGCCAYLLKDIHPNELEKALLEVYGKGLYNADAANINYRRLILQGAKEPSVALTEKELAFLRLASSDMTYKQIAAQMYLSERTIDGYRESVFEKLKVQSRVGMVLEGLRGNLISL